MPEHGGPNHGDGERLAVLETEVRTIKDHVTHISETLDELHEAHNRRTAFVAGIIATVSLIWGLALTLVHTLREIFDNAQTG